MASTPGTDQETEAEGGEGPPVTRLWRPSTSEAPCSGLCKESEGGSCNWSSQLEQYQAKGSVSLCLSERGQAAAGPPVSLPAPGGGAATWSLGGWSREEVGAQSKKAPAERDSFLGPRK